jgi:hypothetical protein
MLTKTQKDQAHRLAANQVDWHDIARILQVPYPLISLELGGPTHEMPHMRNANQADQLGLW